MSAAPSMLPTLARARVALPLLALWLGATAGLRPLLTPDEARYAEVARAMVSGDRVVPQLDGLPFFHKPPLMYWLDAAAMAVLGPGEWAARFAPMFGAWAMGAALFLALRRWAGPGEALAGLAVLATSMFFYVGGQYANHDMLVAGLITVAVLALARAAERPGQVERRWVVAGWAACALAVLAKGLIGVVLPGLVVLPWLLAARRGRDALALLHPAALAVFAAIALPWFVAMQGRFPGFFDYFVVEQHVRRFAESGFNNAQAFWFYFAVLPALTLPWSLALPGAWRVPAADARAASMRALAAWWVVAIVGFFSLPSSKLVGYVLPALAPWSLLLAAPVARWRRWPVLAGLSALACVAVVAALALKAPGSHRALARELAARIAPGEAVVMVDEYVYDLPYYARLAEPAIVASRWDDPDLPRHDNWRKELADAGRFDPAAAARRLWPIERLGELPCQGRVLWFVAGGAHAARVQALPGAQRVAADAGLALWRVPARDCR